MIRNWTPVVLCALFLLGEALRISEDAFKLFPSRSGRIVDGAAAGIESFPWQVSLVEVWEELPDLVCGGSIISSNWVVTAGHCVCYNVTVAGEPGPLSTFISAGSTNYTEGSRHNIAEKVCHPLFEIRQEVVEVAVNDIALVRVKEAFEFDRTRAPIPLFQRAHESLSESEGIASGWGAVNTAGDDLRYGLKSARLKVLSVLECQNYLTGIYNASRLVPAGQICVEPLSGTVCFGDSGGPLAVNGTLVGIASWINGDTCTYNYPAVFTEVAQYRDWISQITLI
ncbi:trypsin delta-like [Venturia canescens]|uniref:trypsin delta-like n=1 Tax=Venturia canescens TaxID=32260 RepID=UPI001C9CB4CC|nr:trypsin delta-like [Venturia canescens]